MRDPTEHVVWETIRTPPVRGPGSSKDAWVAFAANCVAANIKLVERLKEQRAAIRALQGEVALLKRQIATRMPKGRPPLDERLVARLEAEIEHGGSDRAIAARHRVSHMTVYRLRGRMRQREQAAVE
jgi:hypothetical protein